MKLFTTTVIHPLSLSLLSTQIPPNASQQGQRRVDIRLGRIQAGLVLVPTKVCASISTVETRVWFARMSMCRTINVQINTAEAGISAEWLLETKVG